jgi:GPH family glycoside/pentoside/hexuronide:cation symporter
MKETPDKAYASKPEGVSSNHEQHGRLSGATADERKKPSVQEEEDAPLKEILLYAFGNIEGGLANGFYNLMNSLMIVALQMNPMVMGFILSIKTLWDGVTDPVMAHVTDRARTRWGRRRPFILVGGLSRVLLLVLIFLFFPQDESIKTNSELAAEKEVKAAEQVAALAEQLAAEEALAEAGPEAADAVEAATTQKLPGMPKPKRPSLWENLSKGVNEFFANENPYHRTVALYVLVSCLLFTTLTTVQAVPYWALGIELAPSYDGRTRVVTYRSFVDKIMSAVAPWILPFCFLPIFFNVIEGLLWYAYIVVLVGAPSTILMVMYTKERMMKSIAKASSGPGLLLSMWQTGKNLHFLKILFLFQFIGITNGVFAQFMLFLNIYWVFGGDALAGATMGGYVGTLGVIVSIFALPLVNWSCRRFQKHRALRYAIIWMSVGSAAKWFIFTPDSPYLQLALPFFFSIGISAVFTILPTMMADVTDIDELRHGVRREGMFGAVMAFLMKLTGAIQPLLAGAMLVVSGFDVSLGAGQAPETIHNMRLLFSLVPAGLLLMALIALWRYPLTREYMAEVKAQLVIERAKRAAQQAPED